MFISMEFPVWVESLGTTQLTLAQNVHKGSMSTRIHLHKDPCPQGSMNTRDPHPQRIHEYKDPCPQGSISTRIIPTTFILWPFPVSPGGSEPLGQLKAPVDLSLHLQLNSSREVKLAPSFIRPFLIKKMKRKVQAKYWGLQAKREICRENPNPASASLQLKVSAQLKQSVCGIVLHSLK